MPKLILIRLRTALLVATSCSAILTGCGSNRLHLDSASAASGVVLQGRVHGGQQPVSGSAISLYAAGSTGNGTGAVNLLAPHAVTTDNNGFFSITGDYTCPSTTTQVYLVAQGGNPGLAAEISNPALTMMAALGDCGTLSTSTFISVNEVTTAASVWALAQFLAARTQNGVQVGASATNATGLHNAFLIAANLADSSTGVAPGATLPAGSLTELAKLYTLANALAVCVNSSGGPPCSSLFAAATVGNATPSNTLDAALSIARNPGNNISAVFLASSAVGPYQPQLAAAPKDWTMSITYSGGGLNLPGALAIDSSGSVWVANYFGAAVSKFSPAGIPAAAAGFTGVGLYKSYGIAVDGADNAWVTNQQSVTGAQNSHLGSVSKFSSTGVELSGYGYTAGGVYYPQAAAADSTGVIWIANYGNSSATLLASDGAAVSTNGYAVSALPFTSAVALDGSHNAWFAAQNETVRVTAKGAASPFPCCSGPSGIAVDQSGNIWVADYNASSVVQLTSSGTVSTRIVLGNNTVAPELLAIDGGGNIWTSNYFGNSISQIAGSTANVLSPALGFGLDAPLNEPYGIGVDSSGDLWVSNSGGSSLTAFIGIASPIRTPLLGPPTHP
jgi:NHL repeat